MPHQIILIHGGSAFNTYAEYIADLKESTYDPRRENSKGWKDTLQSKIGTDYQVISPEMPNWWNARYSEWKIWFEKVLTVVNEDAIFVGHSLGAIFLAQYFSENIYKKNVKAIFLLAGPHKTTQDKKDDLLADFILPDDMTLLSNYAEKVHLYHSKDDQIVSFDNLTQYQKDLPQAKVRIFKDKGHFMVSELLEIIEDIKNL